MRVKPAVRRVDGSGMRRRKGDDGAARREHAARLEALCAELAPALGIDVPASTVLRTRRVRAGVWLNRHGGRGLVMISRGAVECLDPMALRWVVAHELGHLADGVGRRRLRVVRAAVVLTVLAALLLIGLLPYPVGHLLAIPLVLGTSLGATVVRRGMERAADATAHHCCAADPDAGRRALVALRDASGPRFTQPLFRLNQLVAGYPPFEERVTPPATGRPGRAAYGAAR